MGMGFTLQGAIILVVSLATYVRSQSTGTRTALSLTAVPLLGSLSLCLSQVEGLKNDQGKDVLDDTMQPMLRKKTPSKAKEELVKVMQFNVFEDGLTDSPGNLGLSNDFDKAFTKLLKELSQNDAGEVFKGFKKVRDYSRLPPLANIDATASFFAFIDVAYSAVYHNLGGEARFGDAAPGNEPDLGNSLRTLFLHTSPPQDENGWSTPRFEKELEKIDASRELQALVRGLRSTALKSTHGYLAWDREAIDGKLWKREENIWRGLWMADLKVMVETSISPPADLDASVKATLSRFMQVYTSDPGEQAMRSLVAVVLDSNGDVKQVRTATLQSAVQWLLLELCKHSLSNLEAKEAIRLFGGIADINNVPDTEAGRAAIVFPSLLKAMEDWLDQATISKRHEKVSDTVKVVAPDIATLVEFETQWQKLGAPGPKDVYSLVTGKGSAAIMFNDKFEMLESGTIQMLNSHAPKSNCVAVLQRKSDKKLFLVGAVHLESAKPSDTVSVTKRQGQLKAALVHLSTKAESLGNCVVILSGDFNALFEEFVYGTTDSFWNSDGVTNVQPRLTKPSKNFKAAQAPDPAMAYLSAGGLGLGLTNDSMRLTEASKSGRGNCTRAGTSMVIDFVFVNVPTEKLEIATSGEIEAAANEDHGVYNAVTRWGSDHLPVGAELRVPLLGDEKESAAMNAAHSFYVLLVSLGIFSVQL